MRLRSQFYLFDQGLAAGAPPRPRSARLKPLWVIPRAWCCTASLQAKGVPRHKTAAFVRLQLGRLVPFVDSGVYACRAGDWVHLWFWENQRVRTFCQQHALDFADILLAPESLCLPKGRDGVVVHQCIEGVEAQLWHKNLLLDSLWLPRPIDQSAWESWRQGANAAGPGPSSLLSWPDDLPNMAGLSASPSTAVRQLAAPWAANLLAEQWWRKLQHLDPVSGLVLATGLIMGLAGYWSAKWWVLQNQQTQIAAKIATLSPRVDPLNALRSQALDNMQWANQVAKLRGAERIGDTLESLEAIFARQEVALREFEYINGEMRLVIVPLMGEINIVTMIQYLEARPNLTNIRLLPESDGRVLRVSAKIRQIGETPTKTGPASVNGKKEQGGQ